MQLDLECLSQFGGRLRHSEIKLSQGGMMQNSIPPARQHLEQAVVVASGAVGHGGHRQDKKALPA